MTRDEHIKRAEKLLEQKGDLDEGHHTARGEEYYRLLDRRIAAAHVHALLAQVADPRPAGVGLAAHPVSTSDEREV